ncbi:MAG: branched-chain amino acid transporter AzlC [Clostridia bacterium]|nr:branched-chain amino acid transporter AzlC [Clostridia bacterium]
MKAALKSAFPYTIPVLSGFMLLGITYGVLMSSKGYGVLWAVLMSAIAFCGSMQFVAITLLTTVFNPIQAFLLSLLVNARHLFYGISLLDKYKGLGKSRFALIYLLCDETFSIVSSINPPKDVEPKYFYLSISLLHYVYWISGTFIGSVLGSVVAIDTAGLDFVLTALFLVLFMEQMKTKENQLPGMIGIVCSVGMIFLLGASNMVIPSMIAIATLLIVERKRRCS